MLITILAGMIVANADGALITSFNPHCSPLVVLLFSPFYRWENRGTSRLNDWP